MSENDQNLDAKQDNKGSEGDDLELDLEPTDDDDTENDDDDQKDNKKSKDDDKSDRKDTRKESPQDKVSRLRRELKRAERNLGDDDSDNRRESPAKSKGLDYSQKAYALASGVKNGAEMKLLESFMKNTGKNLEGALESKYFQNELKDLRDTKSVDEAIPKGKNRSGQTARDSVEYWIAKGELPPADQRELRQKVVNAKIAQGKSGNVFSSNPVQGNA